MSVRAVCPKCGYHGHCSGPTNDGMVLCPGCNTSFPSAKAPVDKAAVALHVLLIVVGAIFGALLGLGGLSNDDINAAIFVLVTRALIGAAIGSICATVAKVSRGCNEK